jgi:glycosyltransferase involved in cell wall biosynthesis
MKNRLALCMEYSLAQQGGTEVLVRALAEDLSKIMDVVLVTDDTAESLAASGLRANLVRHLRWVPAAQNRRRSRELAEELQRLDVQIAHFHFGGTFTWGNRWPGACPIHPVTRHGIACVATVHLVHPPLGGFLGAHRPLWAKLALFPLAWGAKCHTLSRTALEFAVSRHDLSILQGCCGPLASRQRLMYHSAVFAEAMPDGREDRLPVILGVGSLGPRKGQVILVEAFNRLVTEFPEWRLVLVGRWEEGLYYEQVRALVDRCPRREAIELRGRLPDDETRSLLRRAAIFAMPSLEEGLGLSLQEALLSGCPAVGTRVGGIPELIDEGLNGRLVAPGDPGALAAALAELMRQPEQRLAMGRQARASVLRKDMSREGMVRNYVAAYQEVLSQIRS